MSRVTANPLFKLIIHIVLFICCVMMIYVSVALANYDEKYIGETFYSAPICKVIVRNYVSSLPGKVLSGEFFSDTCKDTGNPYRIRVSKEPNLKGDKRTVYEIVSSNLLRDEYYDVENTSYVLVNMSKCESSGFVEIRDIPQANFYIEAYLDLEKIPDTGVSDVLTGAYEKYLYMNKNIKPIYNNYPIIMRICIPIILFLVILIIILAGNTDPAADELSHKPEMPGDVGTIMVIIAVSSVFYRMLNYYNGMDSFFKMRYFVPLAWLFVVILVPIYALLSAFIIFCAARLKNGSFISRTLTYRLILKFSEFISEILNRTPLIAIYFIGTVGYLVLNTYMVYQAIATSSAVWIAGAAVLNVAVFFVVGLIISQYVSISEAVRKIAKGDFDVTVGDVKWLPFMKKYGDDVANVNIGLKEALDDRVKSEKLKTELITNVSHDIKTPLTSIINYVDLLKNRQVDDETRKYINILDKKSDRLKTLIENLVDATKISTGSIEINEGILDLNELLDQALGEYADRLKDFEVVFAKMHTNAIIYSDGRYVWRIVENLCINISKYSLPGSRVYIDILDDEDSIYVVFKNTSVEKLNISAEELMERFVRGERSRNSEGSGLGLSIAKSLTELLGGNFSLVVDGDLFKVTIRFNKQK